MTSWRGDELQNHRHQHALAFYFSGAARFEVLLEEHAFVGHVLIDDPETFAVDGDDEAGADLAERFEVGDFVGMRKPAREHRCAPHEKFAAQCRCAVADRQVRRY